jgi:phage terminase small subunit
MPALKNARHERFAQELAKGTPASQAYEIAGFSHNTGNASTLKATESVSKRVGEILAREQLIDAKATEKAITKLAVTKERVLEELARIGFANIADYLDVSGAKPKWKSLKEIPRELLAAVSELVTETVFERTKSNGAPTEVERVKLKFWDKKAALGDLAKHFGLLKEQLEISGTIETGSSARDAVTERLAQLSERVVKDDEKPTIQ